MIDVPVLVKEALREGNTRKNYRFDVYNADESEVDFSIENDNLVKESVRIDERMCSDTELKFGLCEGTQLEFQCFGVENITGRRLKAYVEVNYINENDVDSWHPVTLGWFTVKECSRQASTGILKVSCYNKLLSDYLDSKANDLIEEIQSDSDDTTAVTLQTIQNILLERYEITPKEITSLVVVTGIMTDWGIYPFTFKLVGNNTTYYPHFGAPAGIQYRTIESFSTQRLDINKRYKFDISILVNKIKTCIAEFREYVYNNIQNPDTFWNNFMTYHTQDYFWTSPYSRVFTADCIFGTGNTYNGMYSLEEIDKSSISSTYTTFGSLEKLEYLYNIRTIDFNCMTKLYSNTSSSSPGNYQLLWESSVQLEENDVIIYEIDTDDIESIEINKDNLADVTLRDLVSANYELHCQYGKLDRETDLFSGVELNNNRLLPADTLYPADDLYPNSMSERANRAMYSKLWADEGNVRSFRYLIITYKGTEVDPDTGTVSEVEKKLQRTVNTHGTDDYNMSDNWLFKNLVWADEDVGDYADAMVEKMRNITWFPFEMWCAGLPYIETGDEVEISVGQNTYTSYVLRRTLKGIQNLQDEMINGTLDIF